MSLQKAVSGIIGLMRPLEWVKGLGNMVIAAQTAAIIIPGLQLNPFVFFQAFASVSLLWSGLYTLNDYTDWKQDALHPVKKERAIPSGKIKPKTALQLSIFLILLSLAIAFAVNVFVVACWLAMFANQLLYTMKPFELKKRPILDLISGSMINPIFRFYYGWVIFVPAFNAPIVVLLFIVGLQFGGYGLYRMMSKSHEKKLNIKSSTVVFSEKTMKALFYASIAIGGLAYFAACLFVWKKISLLLVGMLFLLTLPLYLGVLRNPQKENMKKMHSLLYFQYLIFIVAFLTAYYLF